MSSLWSVRSFENKEFTSVIDCFQNRVTKPLAHEFGSNYWRFLAETN